MTRDGSPTRPGVDDSPGHATSASYQSLLEDLGIGVYQASLDGRLLHASPETVRMSGYGSLDEFLTTPTRRLYAHSEDRDRFLSMLFKQGRVRHFQTTSVKMDGTHYPVSLGAVLQRDDDGKPQCIVGTIEDLTMRRNAEQERELLKYTIDSSPVGAYWFDRDGKFIYVNDAGSKALGYTREELLQMYASDVNPRATPQRWDEVWNALKSRGQLVLTSEHRRKDGSRFPVELNSAYFRYGDQEYCNGFATDLTERQALEAQLLQSQKMESVGRLAGGVAHDFNNMLVVILGHADLALEALSPDDPLHVHLEQIRVAARRSAELTGQLLAFARRQPVAPEVVDLNRAVDGMLRMLGRLIAKNVSLAFRPGAQIHAVKLDPSQLNQVVANLCVNANDAIAGDGNITIETANVTLTQPLGAQDAGCGPGEYVVLSVADDGCGIAPEVRAHVFEPFFTTKGPGKGTGLGLATVYGIVRQNGGAIEVDTELGKGTTFRIYLPRYAGDATPPVSDEAERGPPTGTETVLLVEDEPGVLQLAHSMLERLGYRVLCAGAPSRALELAEEHGNEISLLLTDVGMPEMNGRELARRVLARLPGLRCLYMSGANDVLAPHGVIEPGLHFLQKPFSLNQLSLKLREALGHDTAMPT